MHFAPLLLKNLPLTPHFAPSLWAIYHYMLLICTGNLLLCPLLTCPLLPPCYATDNSNNSNIRLILHEKRMKLNKETFSYNHINIKSRNNPTALFQYTYSLASVICMNQEYTETTQVHIPHSELHQSF